MMAVSCVNLNSRNVLDILWSCMLCLCATVALVRGYACPITSGIFVADCKNKGLEFVPWDLPHTIRMFHLEDNNLMKLKGTPFFKFTFMEELWMQNNSINSINDKAFQGCSSLIWLDLSENMLKDFPSSAFKHTPKLQHLILNYNEISYIGDDAFRHLGQLQNLYLTNNKLHAIAPKGFLGLKSLRWLELQNNLLRKLDPQIVQSFGKEFLAIKLHKNPWHCDCSLRWLKLWLITMAENNTLHWEFDLARPMCHSPWLVEGKAFSEVPDSFFVCPVHILSRSQRIELEETDNAELTCEVSADPPATVFWYLNGKQLEIEGSTKYKVINEGGVHLRNTLYVYNFQVRDMGSYICNAVNPAGARNVTFHIAIEGVNPDDVRPVEQAVVETKLNIVTITAIVVGSLVFTLALTVIVCVMIYRRRTPPPHYGVEMKAESPHDRELQDGEKPDDIDEDMMKECNKMDTVDPLYDSIRDRNVQYRNSLNTSTYISFKSEPSDPEDLAMLYASIPKRRYNGSVAGSVTGSYKETMSPLLAPYHIVPPRQVYHVDPLNESADFTTIPLHPQHNRPPSRTPSYCSTPPQHRHLQPQKSCSMGSLGLTPPKKPPRLYTYGSRDPVANSPGNRNSAVGTISLLRGDDSYSTAV
ncbi:leucine-rich repeat-containing protein 24-like [Liolophura sinensis]|uniref:leucine-rich repeat-containing protein 24-like n=1 Tax=Liolophura sinensis TaxID=3198878 RepID=UPI003158309F